MLELIKRVAGYTKPERLQRLIELSVNGSSGISEMEIIMIQAIRERNGEIDEVIKQRERNGDI
jgi:hypothetical protein